jgi:hypothetical protein
LGCSLDFYHLTRRTIESHLDDEVIIFAEGYLRFCGRVTNFGVLTETDTASRTTKNYVQNKALIIWWKKAIVLVQLIIFELPLPDLRKYHPLFRAS